MPFDLQKMIDDYPEAYCYFLEAAYGKGMMSEGGSEAIDHLFSDETLSNKHCLDIGFGLGGVAFYLAEQYNATVTGIEINPWMVAQATRRTPAHINEQVNFLAYHPEQTLPFEDHTFDIVYSKGVLTHLEEKAPLFKEIFRVLKKEGSLIIDDWLSPIKNQWGERLNKMCETEGLTLFAETEANYATCLAQAGFSHIDIRDENQHYYQYNLDIIKLLHKEANREKQNPIFTPFPLDEAIECYQLIADSIVDNELLIRRIKGKKSC